MEIGWLSIDGTLDYETTGFLGTSQCTRIPLIQEHRKLDDKIHWFGIKKGGELHNGVVSAYIVPEVWVQTKQIFRSHWETEKREGGSRLIYAFSRTVEQLLRWFKKAKPLPTLDVLYVQFQDINPAAICYELALMCWYAEQKRTTVIAFDTDLILRYHSAVEGKPKANKYPSPVHRWLTDDLCQKLRNIHLVYVCEPGTDEWYHNLHHLYPVYDASRELPVWHKSWMASYVGNDKTKIRRREAFTEIFQHVTKPGTVAIFGKWDDPAFTEQFPLITWGGRVPEKWMLQAFALGCTSPYLINKPRGKISFKADRICEVAQAGSVLLTPDWMKGAEDFTLATNIYPTGEAGYMKMLQLLRWWSHDKWKHRYLEVVEAQRDLIRQRWSPRQAIADLFSMTGIMFDPFNQDEDWRI